MKVARLSATLARRRRRPRSASRRPSRPRAGAAGRCVRPSRRPTPPARRRRTARPGRATRRCRSGAVDVLVGAGVEGGPLPHLEDLPRGRLPSVRGDELLDEVVLGGLDRGRPLRELVPQRRVDAVDLPLRLGRPAPLLRGPAPAQLGREQVGEDAVVQLGQADRRPEERPASRGCATRRRGRPGPGSGRRRGCAAAGHRPGSPSGRTRSRRPRGRPPRPRRRRPSGWRRPAARRTAMTCSQGAPVRGLDPLPGRLVGQRPRHRHRLRRRRTSGRNRPPSSAPVGPDRAGR